MADGNHGQRKPRSPAATGAGSIHETLEEAFRTGSQEVLQKAIRMLRRMAQAGWKLEESELEDAIDHALCAGWKKYEGRRDDDPPTPNNFYRTVLHNFLADKYRYAKRRRGTTESEPGSLFWGELDPRSATPEPDVLAAADPADDTETETAQGLELITRVAEYHLERVEPRYRESRLATWQEMLALYHGQTSIYLLVAQEFVSKGNAEAAPWDKAIHEALDAVDNLPVVSSKWVARLGAARQALRHHVILHDDRKLRARLDALVSEGIVSEADASHVMESCAKACEWERTTRGLPARKTASNAVLKRHSNFRRALLTSAKEMSTLEQDDRRVAEAVVKFLLTRKSTPEDD